MNMYLFFIASFLFGLINFASADSPSKWKISSPENTLKVTLSLDQESGRLSYEVYYGIVKVPLIEPSSLGLIVDSQNFNTGLKFKSKSKTRQANENYTLLSGKQLKIKDTYTVCDFTFKNSEGSEITIRFRIFETGVAFAYRIESIKSKKECWIFSEESTFNLPVSGKVWAQPYDQISRWTPAYEAYFEDGIPIGARAPADKNGWAFPMLFQTEATWILVTEAGVYDGNASIHLEPECEEGEYRVCLPEEEEAYNVCASAPRVSLPWQSPWRVILISPSLKPIFESNIITSLSRPAKINDAGWIKPGRSSWSWWSASDSPQDYNAMLDFIDLSSEMHWEYFLVDANWNHMKNGNLEKLADYARTKDVGLMVWYNSGGPHNVVTEEPRNLMHDEVKRRETFAWLEKIGVKGIKVDFFQSDKSCITQQYTDILRDAATHKLLVNFHGCTIPKGWRRTYPNLLTMESVKGAECYKFDRKFAQAAPRLNTIYPFTRNVIGPMDYTPVTFSHNSLPHHTSNAHELALSVVFESGILHLADGVDSYRGQPDFVQNFLKQVPVRWDESRLLDGFPGKEVFVARRSGNSWYVAGINGEYEYKEYTLDLSFLENGLYRLELISDGDAPSAFGYTSEKVSSSDKLTIELLTYGGFVALLSPVN